MSEGARLARWAPTLGRVAAGAEIGPNAGRAKRPRHAARWATRWATWRRGLLWRNEKRGVNGCTVSAVHEE